ncbi:hypothetical protein ACJX0J_015096, partial [Zea mays]
LLERAYIGLRGPWTLAEGTKRKLPIIQIYTFLKAAALYPDSSCHELLHIQEKVILSDFHF